MVRGVLNEARMSEPIQNEVEHASEHASETPIQNQIEDEDEDDGIDDDELFRLLFVCEHATMRALSRVSREEEWSPIEVLVLHMFRRSTCALGPKDIARNLHCSMAYASKVVNKLRGQGLVTDTGGAWGQYLSLAITQAGRDRLRRGAEELSAFARGIFAGLSTKERAVLRRVLGRIHANVDPRSVDDRCRDWL